MIVKSVGVFLFKLWHHDVPRIKRRFFNNIIVRKLLIGRDVSSISDNYFFPSFCKKVVSSTEFWNFRQNPALHEILEHVTYQEGANYIENIIKLGFDYEFIRKCVRQDNVGNPKVFNYENLGLTCPSNLRYANVLGDLIVKFGNLDHFSIIEIGGGYGGLARLIRKFFPSIEYTIIDLPEVLLLAERYLRESGNQHGYNFISAFDFSSISCDLLISNYAFSELKREYQIKYLNSIISKSRMGYMIYTTKSPPELNSLSISKVLSKIPNSVATPESPSTGANSLIYWK
jgi:hypothetical protein